MPDYTSLIAKLETKAKRQTLALQETRELITQLTALQAGQKGSSK